MGVIHKLKPEITKFILDNKQTNPHLSCRSLTVLLLKEFQVEVSKSSINAIFKENNLSMPVGRRQNPKKKKFNMPVLPVIESVKAIMLVTQPNKPVSEQEEAEKWAMKLQEEERIRLEEKLSFEKQRLKNEEIKIKAAQAAEKEAQEELARQAKEKAMYLEEAIKLKAEQDKLAKEAQEELARQAKDELIRREEEAGLKAEREKWAKLAEEEISIQKNDVNLTGLSPLDRICSGAIFLKAIDCLIGGSKQINEMICKGMGKRPEDFLALTEAVIFRSLFGFGKDSLDSLYSLVGQQIPQEKLDNYYSEINQNKTIRSDIARIIYDAFREARGVKMNFIDGNIVYLDGQLHTIWSTPHLPYDFTNAVYDLKNSLNKYFSQSQPLVLLSAPGYDLLTKEFFNLLLNISGKTKKELDTLILYGNKLEELESISLNRENNYSLVFGLWPWQFTTSRKINKIGNFNKEHIEGIDKDLYLAEIEVDLLQPSINQSMTFQGCAVKIDLQEKIRVVILSNDQSSVNLNKLADLYFSRWPNLEEGLQDFSRKVEVFTYAGSTQKFFSTESSSLSLPEAGLELGEIFANYINILDAYLRWHFLPVGYAEKDFSFTNEYFYKASAKLVTGQARVTAEMKANYAKPPLKDLEYLLRRLNERQINFGNGKVLYFESAFK